MFGDDGVAVTVALYRMAGDASLAAAATSLAATVRLRSRTLLGPVVPRERSEGFTRAAALAASGCHLRRPMPAWRIRLDSPLPSVMRRHGASVPTGASPHAIRDTWHRGSRDTWTLPAASYGCRARAGFPPAVRLPGLAEMAPDPPPQGGPKRRQCTAGTKAAPEQNAQQACRCCAPRRFSVLSLPHSRNLVPRVRRTRRLSAPIAVVTGRPIRHPSSLRRHRLRDNHEARPRVAAVIGDPCRSPGTPMSTVTSLVGRLSRVSGSRCEPRSMVRSINGQAQAS